jgi:RecA-family ATPase
MNNLINFSSIQRPPAYSDKQICDPSQLEGRVVPALEWLVDGLIPAGKVILFTGDGGLGKSLLMQQLCIATALGNDWLGISTQKCKSFALFCEDDNEELHRRQKDICEHTWTPMTDLWKMRWLSGVGADNTLMTFDQSSGSGTLTPLFYELMKFFRHFKPGLVVIDTLADTFGGNEIIRTQVRTFINGCLGRICQEIGSTVILCGHPSRAGMSSGDGYSGSTAWNNSVRARLYLTRPDDDDVDENERLLSNKKSNYGPAGASVEVRWHDGLFIPLQKNDGGMVGHIEDTNHEKAFLTCLDALTERGSFVSESRNSATYAPKVMSRMPERGRIKKRDIEKAMFSLFSQGDIINEAYGPPSKMRHRIARKPEKEAENEC